MHSKVRMSGCFYVIVIFLNKLPTYLFGLVFDIRRIECQFTGCVICTCKQIQQ